MDGSFTHVTVGKSGIWAAVKYTSFRMRVTMIQPLGSNWRLVPGDFIQIDSGSSGVIYAVNRCDMVTFCQFYLFFRIHFFCGLQGL